MDDFGEIALASLKELRNTSQLADFTIASATGKEWKVHKLVLFMFSDVLHRMSTSEKFVECQTGRIVMYDVQDCAVEALVEFIYSYKLRAHEYSDGNVEDHSNLFIDLWHFADMYNIKGLKQQILSESSDWILGDTDMEYLHCVTTHACASELPNELWQEMVEDLAYALTRKHSYEAEDVKDLLELHPKLAIEVMTEVSIRTFYEPKSKRDGR